jgi:phosphoglycerate dehydrogenase-like enzyme
MINQRPLYTVAQVASRGCPMRVAILDDIHHAYEGTPGVSRLRARAEVEIFTESCREPNALKNFDALVANRERTRFSRTVLKQLPNLRIIAQTDNHVYHIDLKSGRGTRRHYCQSNWRRQHKNLRSG